MSTFRILSFDGGGVKGALSARLLLRITQKYPEILQHTNLYAGTSTGSFIALGLAYNQSPKLIDELYSFENTKYIFSPSRMNLFKPKYSNHHLAEKLNSIFPKNLTLAGLPHFVFVPTFNVKGYYATSFNTVFFNNITNNPTINEKVIDTALCSSAAPTYFPSHHDFIDGGITVNSPTAAPVVYMRSILPRTYCLPDFRLLSIGTGIYPRQINLDTTHWGQFQWFYNRKCKMRHPLLSVLYDSSVPLDVQMTQELLGSHFHRLDPKLDHYIDLDNYKEVSYLKKLADSVDLSSTYRYIEKYYL